jgi:5'-deoxynucleotidase YfbR-like HD superfamily hydrolase
MKLYDIIDGMDRIHRFSHTYNMKPQLLSSHSLRVAMLAWEFARGHQDINYEKLFLAAICHDLEEVFCGDIVHPVKKYFKEYDKVTMQIIENNVEYRDIIDAFRTTGIEAELVELADMIDTPLQALKELARGNMEHIKYFNKFNKFMSNPSNYDFLNKMLHKDNITLFIDTYTKTSQYSDINLNKV